jgi:hypothetical protein
MIFKKKDPVEEEQLDLSEKKRLEAERLDAGKLGSRMKHYGATLRSFFEKKDPKAEVTEKLDLAQEETVDFLIKRHWIALLSAIIVPFVFLMIAAFVVFYRAVGGGFIFISQAYSNTFDTVNILLAAILVIFVAMILTANSRGKKLAQQILVGGAVLTGVILVFRYQGGRVFHIDPLLASRQIFDIYNLALMGIIVTLLGWCIYMYLDWRNDFLILTNERVIALYEVVLGQHSQDQLYIEDIQNVIANRATYLQYWLNFGTVQITSAAYRPPLQFEQATAPQDMQSHIMGFVNKRRQQENKSNFDAMIKSKVYGQAAAAAVPKPKLRLSKSPPIINKLFYENPEVADNGNITWRQHWIFIPFVVIKPIVALVLAFIGLALINGVYPLGTLALVGITLVIILLFLVWAWYVVEDERNELYILQPTNLIDVEKKPLGPEQRNTASIGSVQNVKTETSLIGRIIGYGDVIIETAGAGGSLTFPRLPNPDEVVAIINDYRVRFRKGEKERGLNDTLTLLKHYHLLEVEREEQQKSVANVSPEPETQPQGSA